MALITRPSSRTHPVVSRATKDAEEERLERQKVQRERERRSRERRTHKLALLREQVETLEQVDLTLRLAGDSDVVWDDFLDDDAKRVRDFVRRSMKLIDEAKRLTRQNAEMRRLLTEHELAQKVIRTMLGEEQKEETPDGWKENVTRWRALSRLHFRPWTARMLEDELQAARQELEQFMWSNNKQTTGFIFFKNFKGYDMDHHAEMIWKIYTDVNLYTQIVLDGRAKVCHDLLQEISPSMRIVRFDERYDGIPIDMHMVYLLAKVEDEDGATVYVRSIQEPGVQHAISGPTDLWGANFFWTHFRNLDKAKKRSNTDYRVYLGGTLRVDDPEYISRWLYMLLGALVRAEAKGTGRPLLVF